MTKAQANGVAKVMLDRRAEVLLKYCKRSNKQMLGNEVGVDCKMKAEKSYLEDFKVGDKAVSPGRTVTEADIVMFASLSGDWNELHTNAEYMKDSPFGQRIAHGMLTLSIASALGMRTAGRPPVEVLAFLGMDKVKFVAPVFIGDTIRVESEVIEVRPSKSMPGAGILKSKNTVKNQRDEDVATWETAVMVGMRPKGP